VALKQQKHIQDAYAKTQYRQRLLRHLARKLSGSTCFQSRSPHGAGAEKKARGEMRGRRLEGREEEEREGMRGYDGMGREARR